MNIFIEQSTYDNHPLQVRHEKFIGGSSIWIKVGDARILMDVSEAQDVANRITAAIAAAKESQELEVAPCAA